MVAIINSDTHAPSVAAEQTYQELTIGSLLDTKRIVAQVLPELLERSARDPFFRESFIEDSRLTIESVLSRHHSSPVRLPEYLQIRVVEDSASVVNFVAPAYSETMKGPNAAPSPTCEVLIEAGKDPALLAQLVSSPNETLRAALSSKGYPTAGLEQFDQVTVHTQEIDEIVIVLPCRPIDRVAQSLAIETELNLASGDQITTMEPGGVFYTSTAFTFCGNECSSNICNSTKSYCSCN